MYVIALRFFSEIFSGSVDRLTQYNGNIFYYKAEENGSKI
jgi:hypothetical protein